jgi:hypothetical protein
LSHPGRQSKIEGVYRHNDCNNQLLAHDRWFSPGSPASSTTKTGRHDIAEILLKVVLNTKNQIKSNQNKRYSQQYVVSVTVAY